MSYDETEALLVASVRFALHTHTLLNTHINYLLTHMIRLTHGTCTCTLIQHIPTCLLNWCSNTFIFSIHLKLICHTNILMELDFFPLEGIDVRFKVSFFKLSLLYGCLTVRIMCRMSG